MRKYSKTLRELNQPSSDVADDPASAAALAQSFSRSTLLKGPMSLTQFAKLKERAEAFGFYRVIDSGLRP